MKKMLVFILIFCVTSCLKAEVTMAVEILSESGIYYVDTASEGGDGTTSAVTGEHAAWNKISYITGLVPGDHVLLKSGCLWREELIVTTSGKPGHPIIFGRYGDGQNPILKQNNRYKDEQWAIYYDVNGIKIWETTYPLGDVWPVGILEKGQRKANFLLSGDSPITGQLEDECSGVFNNKLYYRKDSGPPHDTEVGQRYTAIRITGKNHIIIDGIDCIGPGASEFSSDMGKCILIDGDSHDITIKNLTAKTSSSGAIVARDTTKNIVIDNVITTENKSTGISVAGRNVTISNCKSFHNGALINDTGDRGGISVNSGSGWTVIRGCEIYENGCPPHSNADFELSVFSPNEPVIVYGNYIHDCYEGGLQIAVSGGESLIAYNIFENFGTNTGTIPSYGKFSAIRLGAHITGQTNAPNIKVYNNLITGGTDNVRAMNSACVTIWQDGLDGLKLKNNIFYHNDCSYLKLGSNAEVESMDFNHNCYYGGSGFIWDTTNYPTLAEWQIASGQDLDSIDSDPDFDDGWHLSGNSPCLNAGINVFLTRDYEGNWPDPVPDMGIYK